MGGSRHQFARVRAVGLGVVIALVVAVGGIAASAPASAAAANAAPYIVVLKAGTSPTANAKAHGATPTLVYTSAILGYAAELTTKQVNELNADGAIESVTADNETNAHDPGAVTVVPQPAQVVQTEALRVGALESPTARIDGVDERVDVDVAILDSGIDSTHPDLNVVGGFDCVNGRTAEDVQGHGTMVGGLIGAIDNAIGQVGIAAGARLWSIRVANKNGNVRDSALLCGVDWVTAHAGIIEVANLSLGGLEKVTPCGTKKTKPLHKAVCASVAAGVTYVAAAGNDAVDAFDISPAAYDEVIAVSAMVDTDGLPGGLGAPYVTCISGGAQDDTFASFSNFGSVVDISAPGVCVQSTYPGGLYALGSGTSFATPFVAGAAALYRATHRHASPAKVKAALLASAEPGPIAGDPDTFPEGIVNVAGY